MIKVNELKVGAILSYVSLGLTSIISLIYTPIMLRLLGQSEYGLYNLANSVIGYLGILDFGLGNAVIRYTAKYKALNDKEGEESLHGMFIIIYSILAMIIIIAGAILISNIEVVFSAKLTVVELKRMKILMSIMIFNLAISFPLSVFSGIVTAYEHFVFPRVMSIIRAILNPFVMIPLLLMGYKSIGMIVATTVMNLIFIGVNIYYCFVILKVKIKFKKFEIKILGEISGYSFFVFLNIIVDKIYWSTDQFILGAVSGTIAVAIYSVASTINTYYMNFSTAISGVFLPKVTSMVTKNASDEEISELFIKTGRIQYIIMAFILGEFLILGKEFMNVWAGSDYVEAYYICLVVMIPLTIPLIQNLGITILQAKNMHKFRSQIYVVIAILNIFLSIPLAKFFGGIGAAISTGISLFIGNIIIINIYYYKKINIDIPMFWKNIIIMTIPVILSVILGGIINNIININGYVGIFIKGILYSLIYVVLMWSLAINEYEKNLLMGPFTKIKNKILAVGN